MNDSLIKLTANKLAIIELLNQFGIAIDLRDWDSFRGLFADSVQFDYSSIGEVAGILQPDDIANTARQDLGGFEVTQHLITNHLIEIEENTATCNAHVRAMHLLPNETREPLLEIGGYYTAGLICLNSNWKIKSWKFSILWSRGDFELFNMAKEKGQKARKI